MARKLQLLEYVRATANSSGIATASLGPKKYGDSWDVTTLATSTNSALESRLKVYRGAEVRTALVATTYSGNNDNAGGNSIHVSSQDKLVFVWENATVGAECVCRIEGDMYSERF